MQRLSSDEILILLLQFSVILVFARLFGELARKVNQPAVIGEILAGILLGPTVLGYFSPNTFLGLFQNNNTSFLVLDGLASIGVILLLFIAGMELELPLIIQQGKNAIIISLSGIIFPFTLGFAGGWFFYTPLFSDDSSLKLVFSIFLGTALSISALPVIAKTLMDLDILKSQIGRLILAAAMIDDVLGWILFSSILGMIGQSHMGFGIFTTIILMFLFVIVMLTIGRFVLDKILPIIKNNFSFPGATISFVFTLCLIGALFTESIGIHAIFGAFIVGIAVGDSAHLPQNVREILHQFVTNIFAPLFFVSIGLHVNFISNFDLVLVLVILLLAFIAKVAGVGLGSLLFTRLPVKKSLAIGFGMNARGAMGIILGTLALHAGLINEEIFVAIVVMSLVTSVTSGPMIKFFLKEEKELSFKDLLSPDLSFTTDVELKDDVIKELCEIVAPSIKMKKEDVIKSVLERERQIPTGIANYIAIPHCKLKTNKPVLAVAFSNNGIDFENFDGTPAKIIFLLITPAGNNEIQLRLLAEIARTFSDRERVEEELLEEELNFYALSNFVKNKYFPVSRGFE